MNRLVVVWFDGTNEQSCHCIRVLFVARDGSDDNGVLMECADKSRKTCMAKDLMYIYAS